MKSFIKFFMLTSLGLLLLHSCGESSASTKSEGKENIAKTSTPSLEIPKLVNRAGDVGSPEEANKMRNTYQQIKLQIQKNPKDYSSRLKMADLYIVEARATGNYNYYYPAAINMIDGVLEENPKSNEDKYRAYSSKAVILLSLHKFEEAREMGEKALAFNANNSRVYGILTDANVELGDYEEAMKMGDSMVTVRPDLRSYSRISYLREIYGEYEGAQEAMLMAVKAGYPGHEETSWSRVTLGNLYESYGDLANAEMHYRIALENRKGYPFAIAGLGSVESKKGNLKEAEKFFKKAIDIRPEAAFYEQLAMVYRQMNEKEQMAEAAKNAFNILKGMGGDHSHDHNSQNEAHSHNNDHGHSHEVGLEMAMMLINLSEDYDEALHHALHEYARRPDNIEVNEVLAHIYYRTGKYKQAAEHYQKAMVTNIQAPQLMIIGGLIKIEQGSSEEGKEMIRRSLNINPYQNTPLALEAKKKVS